MALPKSSEHKGVLLGVAEVKVPLRHLPEEEKERLSHICYRRLLDIKPPRAEAEDEPVRCIGVVDSFYALQEVILSVDDDLCRLWRKSEIVLQYSLRDVIMSVPAKDHPNRIIILCKTENFGRTATVLQMLNKEDVRLLIKRLFPHVIKKRPPSRSASHGAFRRGAGSFGKAMSKTLSLFLTSIQNSTPEKAPSEPIIPMTTPEPASPAEPCEEEEEEDEDEESESDSDDTADSEPDRKLEAIDYITHSRLIIAKKSLSPIEAEVEFLIDSERQYLNALKAAFHDFHMIKQSDFPMTKEECHSLFLHIEELKTFHETFLEEMVSSRNDLSTLSKNFIDNSHKLKLYLNYISNVPVTDAILASHTDYFKEIYPNLGENLRKPRKRLVHYVLSLESLQKKTSADCIKEDLEKVITLLKENLKEADTRLVIASVQNCKFPLLDHGNVVINSELSLKSGVGLQRRRYQVIVFQDLMVLAKGKQECCQYVTSFSLNDIEIIHALRGVLIHLKVKRTGRSSFRLVFKAKTIKFQQKWIEALQNQKERLNSKILAKELARSHDLLTSLVISNQIKEDLSLTYKKNELKDKPHKLKRSSSTFYTNLHMGDFTKMPPLTIWEGVSSLENRKEASDVNSNEIPINEALLHSEEKLVERLKKAIDTFSRSDHLRGLLEQLYDMHSKYLYPASEANINKCDTHILCHHLLEIAKDFKKLYSEILFFMSVLAYELMMAEEERGDLKIVFDNFFLIKKIIKEADETFNDSKSVFGEALVVINDAIKSSNFLLKKKYIENLPSEFSSSILKEGSLTIESAQNEKQIVYAILTKTEFSILHYKGTSSYRLDQQIFLEKGKLGPPPGIMGFEIIIIAEDKKKTRYQFEAETVSQKNEWLAILERRMPSASKHRKKSLISMSNLKKEGYTVKKISRTDLSTSKSGEGCLESEL